MPNTFWKPPTTPRNQITSVVGVNMKNQLALGDPALHGYGVLNGQVGGIHELDVALISHEDRTRDLTRKGGDKISSIKPNLQDKVANKVAGMVDLVGDPALHGYGVLNGQVGGIHELDVAIGVQHQGIGEAVGKEGLAAEWCAVHPHFVPKVKIRQKGTETLIQFRDRLTEALADATPWVEQVQYNPLKVVDFLTDAKHILEATDYPKKLQPKKGIFEHRGQIVHEPDKISVPNGKSNTKCDMLTGSERSPTPTRTTP